MPSSTRSDRRTRDGGQATVELALCLPFLCLVLLGTVQVALVIRDQLAIGLAAREAARAAAVSADPDAGAAAAARTGLDMSRADVSVADDGRDVTASITYPVVTDLPLIGPLMPDLVLRSSATMAVEPP